jgi:hypothetical protein
VITDWRGEYYANRTLSGAPARVQNDLVVNFDWGQGAPAPGLPADGFSVRWTRSQDFDGATYRFNAYVDDGVRVWVDNQPVIDAWYDSSAHTVSGEYPMTRGSHTIQVEYYEAVGEALIQLWWEKIESYPDWKGEYWSNRDLNGAPLLTRNDLDVNFDWNANSPAPGLPADNFSARWTRTAGFDAGTYRFHALVDDGVRLWVDDRLVLDEWYDSTPHEVTADWAVAQGTHTIRVEYYEHVGGAQISVWWNQVGAPSYPDWKGEYWSNRSLSGDPRLLRNDTDIDFAWGAGAPAPGLPANDFSIRWSREVDFETGVYLFRAEADDGIRFYLDGTRAIDEWHENRGSAIYSAERTLSGKHRLVVEYYERGGDASVKFWWTRVRSGPSRE